MDFVGSGRRLVEADFTAAAAALDIPVALIKAVVEVEAASYGFDDRNRPRILNEFHVFYRELGPGPARDGAVRRQLAAPHWGDLPYPRSSDGRYLWLEAAMAIDEAAAIRACSWGLPQIMGDNHREAGFPMLEDFIAAMKAGEAEQLQAMVGYLMATRLDRPLRERNFAAFARGYNGPGYAKNSYDKKIERAFMRFQAKSGDVEHGEGLPLLRRGARGVEVVRAQQRLAVHGVYRGTIDGDFGPLTELAVRAFQEAHPATGLVDGVIGKNTWAALLDEPHQMARQPATPRPPGSDDLLAEG